MDDTNRSHPPASPTMNLKRVTCSDRKILDLIHERNNMVVEKYQSAGIQVSHMEVVLREISLLEALLFKENQQQPPVTDDEESKAQMFEMSDGSSAHSPQTIKNLLLYFNLALDDILINSKRKPESFDDITELSKHFERNVTLHSLDESMKIASSAKTGNQRVTCSNDALLSEGYRSLENDSVTLKPTVLHKAQKRAHGSVEDIVTRISNMIDKNTNAEDVLSKSLSKRRKIIENESLDEENSKHNEVPIVDSFFMSLLRNEGNSVSDDDFKSLHETVRTTIARIPLGVSAQRLLYHVNKERTYARTWELFPGMRDNEVISKFAELFVKGHIPGRGTIILFPSFMPREQLTATEVLKRVWQRMVSMVTLNCKGIVRSDDFTDLYEQQWKVKINMNDWNFSGYKEFVDWSMAKWNANGKQDGLEVKRLDKRRIQRDEKDPVMLVFKPRSVFE